jgi:hypothetical protein
VKNAKEFISEKLSSLKSPYTPHSHSTLDIILKKFVDIRLIIACRHEARRELTSGKAGHRLGSKSMTGHELAKNVK